MAENKQFLDPEEIHRIYAENGLFIHQVIKAHLGNSPDRDDVFQSFFLRLLEKPIPKTEAINQRSYLYRMIKNSIIDHARRTKTYKNCILRYSSVQPYHKIAYNPAEKTIQEDEVKFIMHIIDNHIPAHIAVTLRSYYKENYSSDQIAQKLSVKRKTVIKYISIGLRRLRWIL